MHIFFPDSPYLRSIISRVMDDNDVFPCEMPVIVLTSLPTDNPFITIYDLDRIYSISRETREHRKLEIIKSKEIVENQLSLYTSKINEMKSDEVISTFYKFAEQIKKEEIDELLRKTEVSEKQLETINIMMNSFTNKLLAPYTNSMKNFIKNNEKYSYILQEYDNMLGKLVDKEKNIRVKNYK